jgi:hypothetical protein
MGMTALLLRATSVLLLIAFIVGGCSQTCGDNDRKCAYHAMQGHSARKLDSWKAALSIPLEARIGPAPAHVVEYLNLDNILNGYPSKPRAARPEADVLADVSTALAEIPPEIRALVRDRLLGLYFVDNLGASAYTEAVLDSNAKPVAAFVVFDAGVYARQKANEWATWKERTPFNPEPSYSLDARIESAVDNNRKSAIRYILLHELGHVLSVGAWFHPPWYIGAKESARTAAKYPFMGLSWRFNPNTEEYESLFDRDFPQRARVIYYKGARLSAADMVSTYARLKTTNFATLYAATKPADDFAESFATYVHVVLMKRPWEITIRKDGSVAYVFQSCWDEPRCTGKRKILEALILAR